MKRYISAMSFDRQTLMNKLYDVSNNITHHLIKLYMFPSSQDVNHWRQEIWSSLSKMGKLSSTKKLPDKKLIYSCISGFMDEIPELVEYVKTEYPDAKVERSDIKELNNKVDSYLTWISNELSIHVAVLPDKVYDKLKEVGL